MNRNGKNCTNRNRLDYRAEGLREIATRTLVEPFCHKTCLVLVQSAIRMNLDTENPFTPNYVVLAFLGNQIPRLIGTKGIILFGHCLTPRWILQGLCNVLRLLVNWERNMEVKFIDGFMDIVLRSGYNLANWWDKWGRGRIWGMNDSWV